MNQLLRLFLVITVSAGAETAIAAGKANPFSAVTAAHSPGLMTDCTADIKKHCANLSPGKDSINTCLKSKESVLSDACKKTLAKRQASAQDGLSACMVEVKQLCGAAKDVPAKRKCLTAHKDKLSLLCRAALENPTP
jgi:hypothetical protein